MFLGFSGLVGLLKTSLSSPGEAKEKENCPYGGNFVLFFFPVYEYIYFEKCNAYIDYDVSVNK